MTEQTVVISGAKSSWQPVTSSIPRGGQWSHSTVFVINPDGRTKRLLSESAGNTKSGRMADMLGGRAATRRDRDRLEKRANRTLMKFNKNARKIWGGITPGNNTGWEETGWEAALQKKDLLVPAGNKLDMRQHRALAAKQADCILECLGQGSGQQIKEDDYSPLLSTGETHPRCYVQFWAPSARKTRTYWSRSSKGPPS